MAKTRFNKDKVQVYLRWMMEQYDEKQKGKLDGARVAALAAANAAVRDKYPESDMVVLRKYRLASTDNCLKFVDKNGEFFGVNFNQGRDDSGVVDIPYSRGCGNQDVFNISQGGRKAIEHYSTAKEKAKEARSKKYSDYQSFLYSCRNVEDAHEVVPLPDELLKKLVASNSTSLIAFNPALLSEIKKEFSVAL